METMKQSRKRLVISFFTIIAMVFTLIQPMGTDVAEAATNNLVQTYTPTENCPVSKVEFVPQSDGQFNLKVTVNLDVLKNAGKISHEIACDKALTEFEKYRVKQDKLYKSDFDLLLEESINNEGDN